MPVIATSDLPAFEKLRKQGNIILDHGRASRQEIRPLHIGLLNMMPDAALQITEQQFMRLIGQSNEIVQFHLHLFTIPGIERSEQTKQHIQKYYETFEQIKQQGIDALIISGANVTCPHLEQEKFWEPLGKIIDWAWDNVTSTLFSCLGTHALMQHTYNQKRSHMGKKCWGVFNHAVTDRNHPLVHNINTRFDTPHSRFNQISEQQYHQAGLRILAQSDQAGVHIAVSPDGIRHILFQGHPEYDLISLLKEYKREVFLYFDGSNAELPLFPENYLSPQAQAILEEYIDRCLNDRHYVPHFPEKLISQRLDNTWGDTTKAIFSNWTALVYQLTHVERNKPFMDHLNPLNPLEHYT